MVWQEWKLRNSYLKGGTHKIGQVPVSLIATMIRETLVHAIEFPDEVKHTTDRKGMGYWTMPLPKAIEHARSEIVSLFVEYCGIDSAEASEEYRSCLQAAYGSEGIRIGEVYSVVNPKLRRDTTPNSRSKGKRVRSRRDRLEIAANIEAVELGDIPSGEITDAQTKDSLDAILAMGR